MLVDDSVKEPRHSLQEWFQSTKNVFRIFKCQIILSNVA